MPDTTTVMLPPETPARVEAGAGVLDARNPHWAESVDLDRLAMNDCTRCVLGQLYGNFWDGAAATASLKTTHPFADVNVVDWAVAHGFYLAGPAGAGDEPRAWRELGALWAAAVAKRRGAREAR